jgi:hypothetical protein
MPLSRRRTPAFNHCWVRKVNPAAVRPSGQTKMGCRRYPPTAFRVAAALSIGNRSRIVKRDDVPTGRGTHPRRRVGCPREQPIRSLPGVAVCSTRSTTPQLRPWNTDHSPATSDEQGTHASCLTLASTVVHASVGAFFVRLCFCAPSPRRLGSASISVPVRDPGHRRVQAGAVYLRPAPHIGPYRNCESQ